MKTNIELLKEMQIDLKRISNIVDGMDMDNLSSSELMMMHKLKKSLFYSFVNVSALVGLDSVSHNNTETI